MKRIGWMILSLLCLLVSVASLFLSIITYTVGRREYSYNLLDLIRYEDFVDEVLVDYTGTFFLKWNGYEERILLVIAGIGVAAIMLAVIGIITMQVQRRNTFSFILTLLGLVGTLIPACAILIAVLMSQDYFAGSISSGLYPVVTPVAMIFCIITVTWKYRRSRDERKAMRTAGQLMRKSGDL